MTKHHAALCFGIVSILVVFALLVPTLRLNASPHVVENVLGAVLTVISLAWLLAGQVALLLYFVDRPGHPHRFRW